MYYAIDLMIISQYKKASLHLISENTKQNNFISKILYMYSSLGRHYCTVC